MELIPLAPVGSSGNLTGVGVGISAFHALAFQFVVENAGAAPTVTYKFQGSFDNVNWYDIGYITDSSDTISQATRARAATGADVLFMSNPVARKYNWFRVVTTGNNNITFRAEAYRIA